MILCENVKITCSTDDGCSRSEVPEESDSTAPEAEVVVLSSTRGCVLVFQNPRLITFVIEAVEKTARNWWWRVKFRRAGDPDRGIDFANNTESLRNTPHYGFAVSIYIALDYSMH